MTKDDIIRMAREAGFTNPEKFTTTDANLQGILSDFWENLDRFAELVRADEREACAKVCEEPGWNAANWCAKQIRARGNT